MARTDPTRMAATSMPDARCGTSLARLRARGDHGGGPQPKYQTQEETLVPPRDRDEQRAHARAASLRAEGSQQNRTLPETVRRSQPAPQVQLFPVRHVDAEFLRQPGRPEAAGPAAGPPRESEGRAARGVREISAQEAIGVMTSRQNFEPSSCFRIHRGSGTRTP